MNFLIVDCQVFQTDAWNRGMGKYSLSLLRNLVTSASWNKKLILCFSDALPLNEEILVAFHEHFPQAEHHRIGLQKTDHAGVANAQLHNKAELLAHFGKEILSKSDFLILALFIDKACPVFPAYARSFLLFYDIIPHLYSGRYLPTVQSQEAYYRHFATIFEANCILTISQTVRDDLILYLGLLPEKIVNIDGGGIDRATLIAEKTDLNNGKQFILMPSGDDIRKNNYFAVQGFETFNRQHGNKYKLLITSSFSLDTQKTLKAISNNVVFTGNVTESELQWLYEQASMVLFATEYEGLGLPILEAVAAKKIIVCSDIPVFQEISDTAFYFFNPYNAEALIWALESAHKQVDWPAKKQEYLSIVERYSWQKTAHSLIERLDDEKFIVSSAQKSRLAIFCPNPSGYSAIGKVVSELHPSLAERFDIDYYFDSGESQKHVRANYLQYVAPTYDAKQFSAKRYRQYDAVLYHIGNSEYHINTIQTALCYPGFIIAHDTYLNEIFELMQNRGLISTDRYGLEKRLDAVFANKKSAYLTTLGNAQLGIITHSDYATKALKHLLVEDVLQTRSNLPVPALDIVRRPKNIRLKIGLAGVLTGNKGLSVIETLAKNTSLSDADFHIFGYKINDVEELNRLTSYGNVSIESDLSDFEYQRSLAGLDILVCYRQSYRGETSLTVLEAMRHGVVAVVRDIGWFSELPDTAVSKASSEDQLVDNIIALSLDASLRRKMGLQAAAIIREDFSARQYAQSLQEIFGAALSTVTTNFALSNVLKQASPYRSIQGVIQKVIDNNLR